MQEIQALSLGREDPLEEEMATHSNILAWRIPWTEEPGRLQPMGLQRVRHNGVTNIHKGFVYLLKVETCGHISLSSSSHSFGHQALGESSS